MFHFEFPVGNTSLVVNVLFHSERIPAPAGAEQRVESKQCTCGYKSFLKVNFPEKIKIEEWAAVHKRIVLSNFLSEYLLEYSSLSTIVLSTLSTLNACVLTRESALSLSHVLTPVCAHSKQLSNNRRLKIKLN